MNTATATGTFTADDFDRLADHIAEDARMARVYKVDGPHQLRPTHPVAIYWETVRANLDDMQHRLDRSGLEWPA